MATVLRNTDPMAPVVASAINSLKSQIGAGSHFHLDASEVTVTAATASDLATSLALCNNIIGVLTFHFADTVALKAADTTSLPALGAAVDLATAETAANLCKASYNTHCGLTTKHYNADATNTIATADATNQSTLNALLNAMKTAINAHLADAPAGASIRLIAS